MIEPLTHFSPKARRSEAEQQLRESEALLKATQWIARLGHYVLDVERGEWRSSEALDDVFGVGAEYPHTTDGWLALVHPEDRDAVRDYFAYQVLAARHPFDRQYRIVRPSDGAVRWVHERGELELGAFRNPVRMVGIIQDVTELREAADQRLRFAERMRISAKMESLGRLAGGVAHDFNNMLSVILGHVDLALKLPAVGREARDALHAIQDAAVRSAELTRQLLGFARQQPIRPRPLDLGAAVQGMARMLERLATERIALELRLAPDLWPTLVDPSQLDQVVTNLVANARDAIAGLGTIRIETANAAIAEPHAERTFQVAPGEYATLTVTDSGGGMEEAAVSHLFEPFFTTKPAGRGTGLGLATVYGIVRQNRGGVEVQTAPGRGTSFRVLFPRHEVEAPRGTAGDPDGAAVGGGDAAAPHSGLVLPRGMETILVVEDEPSVLYVIRRSLEACGYRVLPVGSPEEALRLLAESDPAIELLVTDLMLPGMTGRDLISAATAARAELRVLLLSGHATDVADGAELAAEGLEFLQKPFAPSELALKVRQLLDRR